MVLPQNRTFRCCVRGWVCWVYYVQGIEKRLKVLKDWFLHMHQSGVYPNQLFVPCITDIRDLANIICRRRLHDFCFPNSKEGIDNYTLTICMYIRIARNMDDGSCLQRISIGVLAPILILSLNLLVVYRNLITSERNGCFSVLIYPQTIQSFM
jgi:hypothetical protein